MRRALGEFRIEGRVVTTTVGFHEQIMAEQEFLDGEVRLDFLAKLSQAESTVIQTA